MDRETAYAKLFMDDDLHHSSGYFRGDVTTLALAQQMKVSAVLEKLDLTPGLKLVDVGCGWGALTRAAAHRYRVQSIGITLSRNQRSYAEQQLQLLPGEKPLVDFRAQRWEEFDEAVDRIVCINAFENFTKRREFLARCRRWLVGGGKMVMVTVTADRPVFRVVSKDTVMNWAKEVGFEVEVSRSLAEDYARTLDCFVAGLITRRAEVTSVIGETGYFADVSYYSHCADYLRSGMNDMFEFTFTAA